ncbi:hypothetical protein Daus18300_001807 [Diaporthe australafricana]|uniref:Uncharacterized protein n=1 Tax=Diaporthe australafricana TaxID=127596 RepID=A0ABR3XTE7_9PEZI
MADRPETSLTPVAHATIVIVIVIIITIGLLFTLPVITALAMLRIGYPEYCNRVVLRKRNLPTTEHPNGEQARHILLAARFRKNASKVREAAVVVGRVIALRSREIVEKVRGYTSRLLENHCHRRHGHADLEDDLPIMRQQAWQKLAESHTGQTVDSAKDDDVELKTVGDPKKVTKTIHFDLEGEGSTEPCVQKPEPAVVAGSEM